MAVLDIGMHTTDYALADALRYVDRERQHPWPWRVYELVRRGVTKRHSLTLSLQDAEDAARAGHVTVYGRREPVAELVASALEGVAQDILGEAVTLWGDGRLLAALVTGGGGPALLERIRTVYPHARRRRTLRPPTPKASTATPCASLASCGLALAVCEIRIWADMHSGMAHTGNAMAARRVIFTLDSDLGRRYPALAGRQSGKSAAFARCCVVRSCRLRSWTQPPSSGLARGVRCDRGGRTTRGRPPADADPDAAGGWMRRPDPPKARQGVAMTDPTALPAIPSPSTLAADEADLLAVCRRERGLRQVYPFWRQERQPARQYCRFAGHVAPCLPVQWRRLGAFHRLTALLNAHLTSPGRG